MVAVSVVALSPDNSVLDVPVPVVYIRIVPLDTGFLEIKLYLKY